MVIGRFWRCLMIIKEFVGVELNKAVRRALSFWYSKLSRKCSLMDFVEKCSWKKCDKGYVVIYRGPGPDGIFN